MIKPTQHKHVLLIGKDSFVSMILSQYLRRKGFKVAVLRPEAAAGESADPASRLQAAPARRRPWHAIIADVEILKVLDAHRFPAERKIALAEARPPRKKGSEKSDLRWLVKPVSPESLIKSLK